MASRRRAAIGERSGRGIRSIGRATVASIAAVIMVVSGAPVAANAAIVAEHEITANWAAPVPTSVLYGNPVVAEWHINTNDAEQPESNEDVTNVTATLTAANGKFASLPSVCLTSGVTPASSISADGVTLICNVGTVKAGTATVLQTPIRATSTDGAPLSASGSVNSDQAAAPSEAATQTPMPVTYNYGMDLVISTPSSNPVEGGQRTRYFEGNVERQYMVVDWAIGANVGSRPGPASYSFVLNVATTTPGANTNLITPEECRPVNGEIAAGIPFSATNRPDRAAFPGGCTITKLNATQYRVDLTNIDYSLNEVPVKDSKGQNLPAGKNYIASGALMLSHPSPVTITQSFNFTANAPAWTYPGTTQRTIDPTANNADAITLYVPGDFSNHWAGTPAGSRSVWDDQLFVSPGTGSTWTLPSPTGQATGQPLPLYSQANSYAWNDYRGPNGGNIAGLCTMNQTATSVPSPESNNFVYRYAQAGGHDPARGGYIAMPTARVYYTTANIDTRTFTCNSTAVAWTEARPPAGSVLQDPRLTNANVIALPANVSAIRVMWNPAVDKPNQVFVRGFGYIKADATPWIAGQRDIRDEGWTVGSYNRPNAVNAAANTWYNVGHSSGSVNTATPWSAYSAAGHGTNGYRDVFRIVGNTGTISKSASPQTAGPGQPVTYTVRAATNSTTTPLTAGNLTVVDLLPAGMQYIAGSARIDGVTVSPASATVTGRQQLTFAIVNSPANTERVITYQAMLPSNSTVAPGSTLTNTAEVRVPGDTRELALRQASASVVVPNNGTTSFGKSSNATFVPYSGGSSFWRMTLNSLDPSSNAFTDTIDILPYAGDENGTDIDGGYEVTRVAVPAATWRVYYTASAPGGLSDDARDDSNGTNPGSIAGNTVGWAAITLSGTNAAIPANATAIRVLGPALAPGAQQSFDVHFTTAAPASAECAAPAAGDNKPGQVIVNAATSIAAHTGLPMKSSATTTIADCNQIEIKKYVLEMGGDREDPAAWHDAQDASDFPQYARDDSVPYRITVTNRGTGTLTNVVVTDPMFPQCAYTVGSLAAGASESRECSAGPAALGTTINEAFVNVAPPVGEPLSGSDPAGIVVPLPPSITKTSGPASGSPVVAGDRVTYTVTIAEPEDSPAPFLSPSFTDDLSGVLDDAVIDEDSISVVTSAEDGDPGTAALDGNALRWSSARIFPGEVITITYSVTVKDYDEVGDHRLRNVVTAGADIECVVCTTEHPVPGIRFTKSATPATVTPGGTVTYTIDVQNTGQVAYGENGFAAAAVIDQLTDVLKDAAWVGTSSPGVTFDPAAGVSWSGPLAVGAATSFSFQVQVKAAGVDEDTRDDRLENTIVSDTPGSNCAEESTDPDCDATVLVQSYTVEKSTAETPVVRGDVVTYTLTVRNTGEVAYTAESPASFDDDLVDVLDDADFLVGSATGGAEFAAGHLTWSGALSVGEVRTFTYSVAVKQKPNPDSMVLDNTVTPTATGGSCAGEGLCETTTPIAQFHVAKSSDPAYVNPGGTVHYRIVVTNTGEVAFTDEFPASFRDSFAGIVDDGELAATVDDDGQIVDGSVTWSAGDVAYRGSILDWTGSLAVGGTVTIEYDVLVDNPDRGDHLLTNRITTPTGLANCDTDATDPVCETETPVQSYELVKVADSGVAEVGDDVTYTITVRNTGNVPYPAGAGEPQAVISDPIGDVLEHATYGGDLQVVSGGGVVAYDPATETISWAGDLTVGGEAVITYTVQITSATEPDERLLNRASTDSPGGNCDPATEIDLADPRCWVELPTRAYEVVKSVSDTVVEPGQQDLVYTITVANTGSEAYTGTAIGNEDAAEIRDDLTDTLGDSGNPVLVSQPAGWQVTFENGVLVGAGPLDVDETVTFVYTVDIDDPDAGDHRMENTVATPPGRGGNCTPMSTDPDCDVTVLVREFTVEKTADPQVVEVDGTVVYTVTVRNTGAVAYTGADPAGFADDLSDVLLDADWGTVLQGGAVFDGAGTLSWSGALPVAGEVVVRYTVIANGETADDILINGVDPVGPGGACVDADGCETEVPIRSFEYEKQVDATSLTEGDDVTYTITIRNTGAVAYTDTSPADVVDDLSRVLDDAGDLRDIVVDPDQGEATVIGSALRWEGPLAVDQTVTLSYTLTVDEPDIGDHHLVNAVTSSTGECAEGGVCTTDTPVRGYLVEKSSTPAVVAPDDDVQYAITVTNTGAVAYTDDDPASFVDDLADVLDVASDPFDLAVEGDSDNAPTWDAGESELAWQGELPVGGRVTIRYTVTVDAPVQDDVDFLLENVVAPTGPGGECGDCDTVTPIRAYDTVKTSSLRQAEPGDVVTYTVRIENIGQVAYSAPTQATFTDDLSGVLDDATGPTGVTGGATFADGTISWSGDLPIGGVATVTYSVTVLDPRETPTPPADGILRNAVVTPPEGGCAEPTAPDCITETPVRALHFEKIADQEVAFEGDLIEYTITVRNTGAVDFTADDPAAFDDSLSRVLDDVTDVTAGSLGLEASAGESTYSASTSTIHWEGPLAAGATATITYQVTIANPDRGDHMLANRIVTPPGIPSNCGPDSEDPLCDTTTLVRSYHLEKEADRTEFFPGDVVTYTITLENTGQVAYTAQEPVVWDDPLTEVLDDAVYNVDAVASSSLDGDVVSAVAWDADAGALRWTGKLDVGEVITFTYSVSVRSPVLEEADKILFNRVASATPGGNCSPTSADPMCEVQLGGPSVHVEKTSSKETAFAGEVVEYAITISNDGGIDWTEDRPAQIDDSLVDVLDDATYNGDATEGAELVGSRLKWQGPLAVDESITIRYTVTINAPRTGDGIIDNVVTTPEEVPSNCVAISSPDPDDPNGSVDPVASTDAACGTRTSVQSFETIKTSNAGDKVKPGDIVTYTISIRNTGQVAYTQENPAMFVDDFGGVLDDARYLEDATGDARYDAPELSWAGPLEVGEVTTVTYGFVVNEQGGDNRMLNVLFSSGDIGGNCVDPSVADCQVQTLVERPLAATGGAIALPLIGAVAMLLFGGGLFLWLGLRRGRRQRA